MRRSDTFRVALTRDEKTALRERAAAHGVPMAEYVRRTALAGRPGSTVDVDEVWDSLSPRRKEQIVRWLVGLDTQPAPLPGQMAIVDDASAA